VSAPAPADSNERPSPRSDDHFDVVVVGSLNIDVVVHTQRLPEPGETVIGRSLSEIPGGKGLNQAVAAARCGARVALVGSIGDDAAGRRLRDTMRSEGVDDRWIAVVDEPTGRAIVSVDDSAENSIIVVPGANGAARWPVAAPVGSVVLAQLETPIATVADAFSAARSSGSITVLNPAPAADLPSALLSQCSIVVPNEHEVNVVHGAASLLEAGVDAVVTTLGSRGVSIIGTIELQLAAHDVTPVDTTAAGDAFCGNLAARLAAGDSLDVAVRWANAAGAIATTRRGAVPSLPHPADVRALSSAV
jgi:ribokinase